MDEEAVDVEDASNASLLSSSILDELRRDNRSAWTYSYHSAWSSNYTMSNLPGPGRLLGMLYSRAGSSLEHQLGKFALRMGIGSYPKAVIMLRKESGKAVSAMLWNSDEQVVEKFCEALLVCAQYVPPIFVSFCVTKP